MRKLLPILAFCLACCGCAKSTETAVLSAVEAACLPIVSLEAPAEAPLCVLGDELVAAVIDYIAAHAGSTPATSRVEGATAVAPDLYAALAARPAVKERRAKPKCPVLPPGKVTP